MGRTRWAVAAFAVTRLLWFPSSSLAFQPGKARWPIKTSVPEGADLDHPSRADLGDLIDVDKLPDAPGVTKNDARFQDALIPKFDNPLGVTEGNILSTVGWLHLVAAEGDGDYHIQISPAHDDDHGTDFLIVEVPTPETESWSIRPCTLDSRPCGVSSESGCCEAANLQREGRSSPIQPAWRSRDNSSTTMPTSEMNPEVSEV